MENLTFLYQLVFQQVFLFYVFELMFLFYSLILLGTIISVPMFIYANVKKGLTSKLILYNLGFLLFVMFTLLKTTTSSFFPSVSTLFTLVLLIIAYPFSIKFIKKNHSYVENLSARDSAMLKDNTLKLEKVLLWVFAVLMFLYAILRVKVGFAGDVKVDRMLEFSRWTLLTILIVATFKTKESLEKKLLFYIIGYVLIYTITGLFAGRWLTYFGRLWLPSQTLSNIQLWDYFHSFAYEISPLTTGVIFYLIYKKSEFSNIIKFVSGLLLSFGITNSIIIIATLT